MAAPIIPNTPVGLKEVWVSQKYSVAPSCESARTKIVVTVYPNPMVSITGSGNFCPYNSAYLVATPSGMSKYKWTNSSGVPVGTNSDTFITSTANIYTVEVTDGNGCKNTATKRINEVLLSATIQTNPSTTVCEGETIELTTVEKADLYIWSLNGTPIGMGPNFSAIQTGLYEVELTFGTIPGETCSTRDSKALFFFKRPAPEIAQSDTVVGESASFQLVAADTNGLSGTFTWYRVGIISPIGTGNTYTVTETGNYYVVLDNSYCTTQSAQVSIEVTGVNHNIGNLISVNPNPSTGLFKVNLPVSINGSVKINIYNTLGEAINSLTNSQNSDSSVTIDLQNSPDGVYLLEIETYEGIAVKRIIKQ